MREFITNALGNPEWERLVRARWLKKRQLNQDNDFDPLKEKIAPIFVRNGI